MRSPSVFDTDATVQTYIHSGAVQIVKGDALNKDDVQRGWLEAAKHLKTAIFPASTSCSSRSVEPPSSTSAKASSSLRHTLSHMRRSPHPRIVTVTTTGLTKHSHSELPMAMRAMYGYLLRVPHADKQGVSTLLARASGTIVARTMAPPEGILPEGWKSDPDFPNPGAVHDDLVIIRPAFLTDGPCWSETKDPSFVRTRAEADLPVKGGYTISRRDVADFIAERVLGEEWDDWRGKGVYLSH